MSEQHQYHFCYSTPTRLGPTPWTHLQRTGPWLHPSWGNGPMVKSVPWLSASLPAPSLSTSPSGFPTSLSQVPLKQKMTHLGRDKTQNFKGNDETAASLFKHLLLRVEFRSENASPGWTSQPGTYGARNSSSKNISSKVSSLTFSGSPLHTEVASGFQAVAFFKMRE